MDEKQDKFLDKIIDFIKALPDEEKLPFASEAVFQIALWAGFNHIEMMGILECAKGDIMEYVIYAEEDDNDGDDWKKLVKN
jgi:hypothetical protein